MSDGRSSLIKFPVKCCDHGMRLLALYLTDLGYEGLSKAKGSRPGHLYHVWLVQNGIILDITADQFDEGLDPVIVTRRSPWHDAWKPELRPIDDEWLQKWRPLSFSSTVTDSIIT
jgi:hypothetical protein